MSRRCVFAIGALFGFVVLPGLAPAGVVPDPTVFADNCEVRSPKVPGRSVPVSVLCWIADDGVQKNAAVLRTDIPVTDGDSSSSISSRRTTASWATSPTTTNDKREFA